MVTAISVIQRQCNPCHRAKQIGGDQHLQRLEAFAAIVSRLGLAADHFDHVVM